MFRRIFAATEVTYRIDEPRREMPDHTMIPTPGVTAETWTFRPAEASVRIDWTSGETTLEVFGPRTRGRDGQGWYRVTLRHYNDAQTAEYGLVRDVVGQACIDRDKRNI